MIATMVSRTNKIICVIIVIVFIFNIRVVVKLHNRPKIMCPAIIFAANRTDKVMGRIDSLINSTQTIKGVINIGVPLGIRCAFSFFGVFIIGYMTDINHTGMAMLKVIDGWEVCVNVYGNSPKVLFNIMNSIKIIRGVDFPMNVLKLILFSFMFVLNSGFVIIMFDFHVLLYSVKGKMNNVYQKGRLDVDGSNVENKFIIFNEGVFLLC